LFENNLLAVDKYLATINTTDGKLGVVGEHYLSQMWCTMRGLAASWRAPPHAAHIHMYKSMRDSLYKSS